MFPLGRNKVCLVRTEPMAYTGRPVPVAAITVDLYLAVSGMALEVAVVEMVPTVVVAVAVVPAEGRKVPLQATTTN